MKCDEGKKSRVRRTSRARAGSGARQRTGGSMGRGCSHVRMSRWLSDTGNFKQSPKGSEGWALWLYRVAVFQAKGTVVYSQWTGKETARRSGGLSRASQGKGHGHRTDVSWLFFGRIPLALCGRDSWEQGMDMKTMRRQESLLIRCVLAGRYPQRWSVHLKIDPFSEGWVNRQTSLMMWM